MKTLIKYEFLKILRKKSTLIVMAASLLITAFFFGLPVLQFQTYNQDGVLQGLAGIQYEKEQYTEISVPLTNEYVTKTIREVQELFEDPENVGYDGNEQFLIEDAYWNGIAPRESLLDLMKAAARKEGVVPEASLMQAYDTLRQALADKVIVDAAVARAPFIDLARPLALAYLSNIQEEGRVPAVLVPDLAARILDSPGGVPAELCRLGTRLSHFFVDEFQDTSREQWQALKPLIIEALSRGGSLTWVGDVKQAIYGWRGGDATLFDEVLEDPQLRALEPQPEQRNLPCNWRSRRVIVEHNNTLFAGLEQEGTARAAMSALLGESIPGEFLSEAVGRVTRAFAGAAQRVPEGPERDGGFVQVSCLHAANKKELDELVLQETTGLLRRVGARHAWSDILVLVRANKEAATLVQALTEAGIPVITENSLLLAAHPLVRQTVAFLSFLSSPADDVAFWTVVAGSIVQELPGMPFDWQS